jgi:hypothetical protein
MEPFIKIHQLKANREKAMEVMNGSKKMLKTLHQHKFMLKKTFDKESKVPKESN